MRVGHLPTNLVIQDLVLLAVLLESAKELDDIRILIKRVERKPGNELYIYAHSVGRLDVERG